MIVQIVKFKSSLSNQEVKQIMRERAPRFREQKDLLQKYYGYEESTGMHGAVYIWKTKDAMEAFRQTELAKSIPIVYRVEGAPRVEILELIFPLRDMAELSATMAA